MRVHHKNLTGFLFASVMGVFWGLFFWSAYRVFVHDEVYIYAEHGLLENIQAIVLAVAILAFLVPIAIEDRSDKLILLFFTLLCFSFLLRELDVKHIDAPKILILIGSGVVRIAILAVAFIAIAAYAAFRFSHYKNEAFRFLKSKVGGLLIMGGVFLWIGEFFEKKKPIMHYVFFEEISELFAYFCILLSAFMVNSRINGQITIYPNESGDNVN
ncbi:MAG: hypothetical protein ACU84H_14790 [Gammaproteobacteria bacterium]